MQRNFRIARACAREAVRDFNWHEYAPFGWILGAQLALLFLAVYLWTPIGMALAGGLTQAIHGERSIHYPVFFIFLPITYSWLEVFLYAIPGSLLIPLALIRIMSPMDPALSERRGVVARLKQAFLPTFLASAVNVAILFAWQWLVEKGPQPILRSAYPGFVGVVAVWTLSLLGGYLFAALLVYVPIAAIRPGATLGEAVKVGVSEGWSLLLYTFFFQLIFTLPALPFLLATQLRAQFIVDRLYPEVIAVILALYAALISVANYLTYAAAARLHWAAQAEES